ncbi:MAG: alpha/beta hydrolase [Anaerolineae bacterium]
MKQSFSLLVMVVSLMGCASASPPPPIVTPTALPEATRQPTVAPTATVVPTAAPEPTAFQCDEPAGRIEMESVDSAITGEPLRYRVYLPPCYETANLRYPTLYMFHGMDQVGAMNDDMWDRLGLDEAATNGYLSGEHVPLIIVMPNGWDAGHDRDDGPYPRVVVEELIPRIEADYCTSGQRAVGGLSRGGYWAYAIAFLYPEVFERVGGHSGFFYAGDYPQANPYDLIPTAQGIEELIMYLDYGAADTLVPDRVDAFNERLVTTRNIEPTFIVYPEGGHDEAYWSAHVDDYLDFYTAAWSDLSPCSP